MLSLETVSLIGIDSVHLDQTIRILDHCKSRARFHNVFLFTHERRTIPQGTIRIPIPQLTTHESYSQFLLWDFPLYLPLLADHVLVVQHDGFIVRPEAWEPEFLEYDYIGAPWSDGVVGNGGFSLRSRRLLEALAEIGESLTSPHPEDIALSRTYRPTLEALGLRFAPTDVARRFSVENEDYRGSFGFHGHAVQQAAGFSPDAIRPSEHSDVDELQRLYDEARNTPSDFNEHVPTLARLARTCPHITEFGMRFGVSTRALLFGRPEVLVSYDMQQYETAATLESAARHAGIAFRFIQADVLTIEIDETDLLFIDTDHTFAQIQRELERHAQRVRRFIVLHDTTTFGTVGGDGGRGMWPAIETFLTDHPEWRIREKYDNNHGLTVLARSATDDTGRNDFDSHNEKIIPVTESSSRENGLATVPASEAVPTNQLFHDRRRSFAKSGGDASPIDSFSARIRVYYHCYLVRGWEALVAQQMARCHDSGLAEAAQSIVFGVIGDDLSRQKLMNEYRNRESPNRTIFLEPADCDGWEEFKTLRQLHEDSRHDRFDLAWYFHTKGVTRDEPSVTDWRHLMEYFLMDRWRDAHVTLWSEPRSAPDSRVYDLYGVNWWTPEEASQPGGYNPVPSWSGYARPHFSGNFFAATAAYLRRLPEPRFHERRDNEFWVGQASPRVFCPHAAPVEHYSQPYPESLYRS